MESETVVKCWATESPIVKDESRIECFSDQQDISKSNSSASLTTEEMNCEEGELKENKCEDLKKKPCPWRMTCTDLRQKISGNMEALADNPEWPQLASAAGKSPKKSNFDLRQRLNKGDQEKRDVDLRGQRLRGGRVSKAANALSPLRSPRTDIKFNILDSSSHRNSRYGSNSRKCDSPTPSYGRYGHGRSSYSEAKHRDSPDSRPTRRRKEEGGNRQRRRRHTDESRPYSDDNRTMDEETERCSSPLSESQGDQVSLRTFGSRRRLELPKEDGSDKECDDSSETSSVKSVKEYELDEQKLQRRQKDIQYGKTTEDYKLYTSIVDRLSRSTDQKLHPRTPDKKTKCPRRAWDSQVKVWKLRLHSWASSYNGIINEPAAENDQIKMESDSTEAPINQISEVKTEDPSAESDDAAEIKNEVEDEDDFLDVGVTEDLDLDTSEIEQMSINV